MKLGEAVWVQVRDLSREVVVILPTGSIEQHGHHLPLCTDSCLVTAVAEAVETRLPEKVLLLPTLTLGLSLHHRSFSGTLSAYSETYLATIRTCLQHMTDDGFHRFLLLNGHGGNIEGNRLALREHLHRYPNQTLVARNYFDAWTEADFSILDGATKGIRHACEVETSLMLHVRPDLVRMDEAEPDGLVCTPPISGLLTNFDHVTDRGNLGDPQLATAEKGKVLFTAAVERLSQDIQAILEGHLFRSV